MANNIQTNQIYNHFLTAYAPREVTRADTHKKDELRNVYRNIVKLSKESPLYLLSREKVLRFAQEKLRCQNPDHNIFSK